MTRVAVSLSLCGLMAVVVTTAAQPPSSSPYARILRAPSVVNGQALYSFAHDPVDNRLYAASEQGLFWIELDGTDGRVRGPLVRKRMTSIEIAPDTGRLFYTTLDEVGMVKLRSDDPPVRLTGREWRSARLAYEPTRRQMYLPTRDGRIRVFDAESGERSPDIVVPGDYANMLEAVPGKVFFSMANRSGLYVIDAATKTVREWPVTGTLITPAYLDADHEGRFLFATYDRYVVAIDIARAAVVGRLATATGGRIAWDPQSQLLITSEFADGPRLRLTAYQVDAHGFTEAARLENPDDGLPGLESLRSGGFLQSGRLSLLIWRPVASRSSAGLQ